MYIYVTRNALSKHECLYAMSHVEKVVVFRKQGPAAAIDGFVAKSSGTELPKRAVRVQVKRSQVVGLLRRPRVQQQVCGIQSSQEFHIANHTCCARFVKQSSAWPGRKLCAHSRQPKRNSLRGRSLCVQARELRPPFAAKSRRREPWMQNRLAMLFVPRHERFVCSAESSGQRFLIVTSHGTKEATFAQVNEHATLIV